MLYNHDNFMLSNIYFTIFIKYTHKAAILQYNTNRNKQLTGDVFIFFGLGNMQWALGLYLDEKKNGNVRELM